MKKVLKKIFVLVAILAILMLPASSTVSADESDDDPYSWKDHQFPFDFPFENMIDSHQQSRILQPGKIHGFIYIHYTGVFTDDGYPMAERANCPVLQDDCDLGWVINGVEVTATLVNKGPRIWLINEADIPPGGGYTHFQWVGEPNSPSGLVVGQEYEGILLKRIAPEPFFWLGNTNSGGGGGCGDHHASEDGLTTLIHEPGGEDEGDCSDDDHDDGCSGGGGGGQGAEHDGRLVLEGIDAHSNVVTFWDGSWHGDGCHED